MDLKQIEEHWKTWAATFGSEIRATEKSKTRKALEIDALVRAIHKVGFKSTDTFSVLEPGCGTGYNCLAIAEAFPNAQIFGFDYILEMIENARLLQSKTKFRNIHYAQGNLLDLSAVDLPVKTFDLIFTNRCLINLNTIELQSEALINLKKFLKPHGIIILAENPQHKFNTQNELRDLLNLPPREPPEFNVLLNEEAIIGAAEKAGMKLVHQDDFSALHDLLLYVLLPKINGGKIDYEHPILEAVMEFCPKVYANQPNAFGSFGQNKLYTFKKS
ncbi:MAG: class I SAM-dependent methyltransferase [Nitrospina sp.]|jgi:SAM-dependent methyltransferase|nr:class I SAM-dependent methyltransferase [Nitrospina sp.]